VSIEKDSIAINSIGVAGRGYRYFIMNFIDLRFLARRHLVRESKSPALKEFDGDSLN
jgi:hypothetical protein